MIEERERDREAAGEVERIPSISIRSFKCITAASTAPFSTYLTDCDHQRYLTRPILSFTLPQGLFSVEDTSATDLFMDRNIQCSEIMSVV